MVQNLIEQEINRIPKDKVNDNNEYIAFVKATNKALRVTTGQQALEVRNIFMGNVSGITFKTFFLASCFKCSRK